MSIGDGTGAVGPRHGSSPSRVLLLAVLLVLVAAAVFVPGLGRPPVSDSAELRCFEIVQGMVDTGDWLVPRRHGQLWVNKPPLFYWSGASLAAVLGEYDRWVLRLPSAIFALLLVGAAVRWGSSLRDPSTGLLAGAMLVLMPQFVSSARHGSAEMTLALCANLSLLVFDRAWFRGMRRQVPLFALFLGLGVLAKATAVVFVILLPILVQIVLERGWSRVRRRHVLWGLAGLLAGFLWYVALVLVAPEAWDRLVGELLLPVGKRTQPGSALHRGPPWDQVVNLLKGSFPVSLLLPVVALGAFRTRLFRGDARRRFPAVIVLSQLVAWSILPQKQPHYLLPLLPAFAVWTAMALRDAFPEGVRPGALARRSAAAMALVLGGLLAFAVVFWAKEVLGEPLVVWGGAALLALSMLAACAWTALRGRVLPFAAVSALGWLLVLGVYLHSLNVWRKDFKTGAMVERADYDAAHWQAVRAEYPFLEKSFSPDEDWSGDRGDEPDDG